MSVQVRVDTCSMVAGRNSPIDQGSKDDPRFDATIVGFEMKNRPDGLGLPFAEPAQGADS